MKTDHLTIKLSNRRPVRILRSEWPVIAHVSEKNDLNGDTTFIRVRQDGAGGRRIVYGVRVDDEHVRTHAGVFIHNMADGGALPHTTLEEITVEALLSVGSELLCSNLASRCLDKLPPERV